MKKGPWTVEEDQVLLEYVRKYGPRDWSSIRSKGLLPRTGKSCRLRWVNKLKPNLKRCKFSADEERVVLELQAKIGNKWAKIATYLPGRTDNDVKNFWSTRQKKLARMLNSSKSHKNSGNLTNFKHLPRDQLESAAIDQGMRDEGSSSGTQPCQSLLIENTDSMTMVQIPDLINQTSIYSMGLSLPPPLDLPLLPESQEFIPELVDPGAMDLFGCHTVAGMPESEFGLAPELRVLGPMTGLAGQRYTKQEVNMKTSDGFFDDLPPDMFDCIEPSSDSSQWRNASGGQ